MDEKTGLPSYSIIPEFYFDLISRVTPGMLLIASIIYQLNYPLLTSSSIVSMSGANLPSLVLFFVIVFIFSYSTGILLSVPGGLILRTYRACIWKKHLVKVTVSSDLRKFYKRQGYDEKGIDSILNSRDSANYQAIYRKVEDLLKDKNERALKNLPKMMAETALCNNIIAAIILSLIFHFLIAYLYSNYFWGNKVIFDLKIYICFFLLIASIYYIAMMRYDRLLSGLFSYLNIFLVDEKKAVQNNFQKRDEAGDFSGFLYFKSEVKKEQ